MRNARPHQITEERYSKWGIDMRLKILQRTPQKLKLEIEGEGHTILNLLESTLLEDENVEFAGYHVPHPLFPNSILLIRTKEGKKPEEALIEALEKMRQKGKELSQEVERAFKEWEKKKRSS